MGTMNIYRNLYDTFCSRELTAKVKEGRSLIGFILDVLPFSTINGVLFGFWMGIGLGLYTAINVDLVVTMATLLAILITWSATAYWVGS
jgi:Mg/Co/Ni transporter MgtE